MTQEYAQRPVLGGTDGFRDEATSAPGPGRMNPETVAGMTYALVAQQIEEGEAPLCVIGRDTRPSGPGLETAAVAGALAAGAEVYRMQVAPTPAVLRTAQQEGAGAAVVISASHNEASDNGWKGTLGADKPFGQQVNDISDRYWRQVGDGLLIAADIEQARWRPDLLEAYTSEVVTDIEREFGERPLEGKTLVVDAANGAAMRVTPTVLRRLGATVEEFACDGSGLINDGCGATELGGVQKYLLERPELVRDPNFIGVVANDGDADRMIGLGVQSLNGVLHFDGLELDGNRIMELLAQGQPGIVGTEYTNDAMVTRLRGQGIGFDFCKNGDVNVTAALRKRQADGHNWTRGGEFTGHHVAMDWLSSGDGVRMDAWAAAYAAVNNTNFAELSRTMLLWPEKMLKLRLVDPEAALGHSAVAAAIEVAPEQLDGGRVLVRPSGTEAGVVRAWAVGPDAAKVETVVTGIANVIQQA